MYRPFTLVLAIVLAGLPVTTRAQSDPSIGTGVGTVRFADGASMGVAFLGPALQLLAPTRTLWVGGTIAALPEGDWYRQGRFSLWTTTRPLAPSWRPSVDMEITGASRGAGTGTAAATLVLEAMRTEPDWGLGLGIGPAFGWIRGESPVSAVHARLRAWWLDSKTGLLVSGSLEPTRLPESRFADLSVGFEARRDRVAVHVSAVGRVSTVSSATGAAVLATEVQLTPLIAIEAAGGNVLRDPYQGFPRSGFATLGLRLHLARKPVLSSPAVRSTFIVVRRSPGVLVRLRKEGVRTVQIAGDWNDWSPEPLHQSTDGLWEVALDLPAGIHHFALLLNGVTWFTPDGVPTLSDGMGGRVAVLTLP